MTCCYGIDQETITGALLICLDNLMADQAKEKGAQALRTKLREICDNPEALAAYRENPENVTVEATIRYDIEPAAMLLFLDKFQNDSNDPFAIIERMLAAGVR